VLRQDVTRFLTTILIGTTYWLLHPVLEFVLVPGYRQSETIDLLHVCTNVRYIVFWNVQMYHVDFIIVSGAQKYRMFDILKHF